MSTPSATAPPKARFIDRLVLIFPMFLVLAIVVMIWSLQSNSDQALVHPSVGIFHSGEMATQNGVTGSVELSLSPGKIGQLWRITVRLLDQDANPVSTATLYAHSVEDGRYGEQHPLHPGSDPGTWTGELLLLDSVHSVMVHADLPGGTVEEWIAEWKPKGTD